MLPGAQFSSICAPGSTIKPYLCSREHNPEMFVPGSQINPFLCSREHNPAMLVAWGFPPRLRPFLGVRPFYSCPVVTLGVWCEVCVWCVGRATNDLGRAPLGVHYDVG